MDAIVVKVEKVSRGIMRGRDMLKSMIRQVTYALSVPMQNISTLDRTIFKGKFIKTQDQLPSNVTVH